jgi:outer membrane protein W
MRDGMRLPIVLLLIAAPATAQLFTYGLKIGAPLTDPSGNVATSRSNSVGPSVEFALPNRFAVEASAILHHFSSTSLVDVQSDPQTTPTIASRIRGNAWEFPFLAKRYFGHPSARVTPYAGAGVAFRTIGYQFGGTTQSILSGTNLLAVSAPLTPIHTRTGFGAGTALEAGFRIHVGRVLLLPEVRYTHWGRRTGLNQEDVSMNLGFRF